MSGRHGSVVFIENDDLDLIESSVLSLLTDEQYSYGAMARIPIAILGAGLNGWSVLIADPPFDFSGRTKDGTPWLSKLTRQLNCDAFQLDAGDYSAGLLEANSRGAYLISGLLRRWDSGEEPDVDEGSEESSLGEKAAPLRLLLRGRDSDSDDRERIALRLARSLVGPDFDPREPEEFEFEDQQEIVYQPLPDKPTKKAAPASKVKKSNKPSRAGTRAKIA